MHNRKPLVSVIVPFYNLEEYVSICVESLLAQTYTNMELILVDDGSEDRTGLLLDEYAGKENVKVVHKRNGGLSDARNMGVSNASGQYVTFVDGDDYVSSEYLEHLVGGLDVNSDAMVVSGLEVTKNSNSQLCQSCDETVSYKRYKISSAMELLLYGKITASACAKLAPTWMYSQYPFPVDSYYEEISTAATYIRCVNEVIYADTNDYFYVMRSNSIVHKKRAKIKQACDYYRAIKAMEETAIEELGNADLPLAFNRLLQYSRLFRVLNTVEDSSKKDEMKSKIMNESKEALRFVLRDSKVGLAYKIRFIMFVVSPCLYGAVFNIYERVAKC